jgi:hypothetical protein
MRIPNYEVQLDPPERKISMHATKLSKIAAVITIGLSGMGAARPATASGAQSGSSRPAVSDANSTYVPAATLAYYGCRSACDGKNPATYKVYYDDYEHYHCADDAETKALNTNGIRLELRYSPRCRTAWTRVSSDFYYPTIKSYYTSGALRKSYSGLAGPYYTLMVNDADLLAQAWATAGPTTWWTSKY